MTMSLLILSQCSSAGAEGEGVFPLCEKREISCCISTYLQHIFRPCAKKQEEIQQNGSADVQAVEKDGCMLAKILLHSFRLHMVPSGFLVLYNIYHSCGELPFLKISLLNNYFGKATKAFFSSITIHNKQIKNLIKVIK